MLKKFVILTSLVLLGCDAVSPLSVVPLGINVYLYWKDGEARKYYTGDVEPIFVELKSVVQEYEHTVAIDEIDEKGGHNFVTNSKNHKFKWYVIQYDPKVVLLKCRIDFMGDKPYVELMYKELDKRLGVKTTKIIDESSSHRWRRLNPS